MTNLSEPLQSTLQSRRGITSNFLSAHPHYVMSIMEVQDADKARCWLRLWLASSLMALGFLQVQIY